MLSVVTTAVELVKESKRAELQLRMRKNLHQLLFPHNAIASTKPIIPDFNAGII